MVGGSSVGRTRNSRPLRKIVSMSHNNGAPGDNGCMCKYSMFPCGRDSMEIIGKSTITGKYQLTLPKNVRELLNADNGDLIVFLEDQGRVLVKRGTVTFEE